MIILAFVLRREAGAETGKLKFIKNNNNLKFLEKPQDAYRKAKYKWTDSGYTVRAESV